MWKLAMDINPQQAPSRTIYNYPTFIEDGKVTFTVPADASGTYSLLGEITGAPAYRYVNPHLEIKVG